MSDILTNLVIAKNVITQNIKIALETHGFSADVYEPLENIHDYSPGDSIYSDESGNYSYPDNKNYTIKMLLGEFWHRRYYSFFNNEIEDFGENNISYGFIPALELNYYFGDSSLIYDGSFLYKMYSGIPPINSIVVIKIPDPLKEYNSYITYRVADHAKGFLRHARDSILIRLKLTICRQKVY